MKAEYKNSIATNRNIMLAYLSLYKEHGNKFTVSDVIKHAKINRGTFYLHFKNLQDVNDSIRLKAEKSLSSIEEGFRMSDIDQAPELLINKLNQIILEDKQFYELLIPASETIDFLAMVNKAVFTSISNNFKVMKYIMTYEHFNLVTKYIIGGVLNIYRDWFLGKITCPLSELESYLSLLIRQGLKGCIDYES